MWEQLIVYVAVNVNENDLTMQIWFIWITEYGNYIFYFSSETDPPTLIFIWITEYEKYIFYSS